MKKNLSIVLLLLACTGLAQAQNYKKIGIIGLDTSHSENIIRMLNGPDSKYGLASEYEVVAAYPYGTLNIESATKRIPKYTAIAKEHGVEITESIADLLSKVDYVFLETNDGNLHVEQAVEIFKSGKPCFIDKPAAGTLGQVIALYKLAEKYGQKTFSVSSLRYSKATQDIHNGVYGFVKGADCFSPHHPEVTHPDFSFYGIHGVETLFTVMGRGCKYVSRVHSDEYGDIVSGVWNDGRLGTFRAITSNPNIYGGQVLTEKGMVAAGPSEGMGPTLDVVFEFFKTGVLPVEPEETIEIFTFMKASNMSLERGGRSVSMEEAYKAGLKEAKKILKKY